MMKKTGLLAAAFAPLLALSAFAQGLVIPEEPDLPPLALTRHHVRVQIDGQGAVTTVEQAFLNNTGRRLEAHYVFPIPKGAALSRFTLKIDGREVAGEILERSKARSIYNSIVQRTQEPGLLDDLGRDLFRANMLIENGSTRTVSVRFEEVLASDDGLIRYVYPVRNGTKRGPTVNGEARFEVSIRSASPIRNVYSPSHPIVVERPAEREARAVFAEKNTTIVNDFQLYYSVSEKEVGFSVVAHRPDPSQPGTFMMLISPRSKSEAERIAQRDVIFVVDTSGSMEGEKIKQVQNALRYCITNLNDGDRFGIVRFGTEPERWNRELVSASDHREAALGWVEKLTARGGTDIEGALQTALSFPKDPARPYFVLFLTDGQPTIGEANPNKLLSALARAKTESVRIFTWGVGYDVDTRLLDGIAEASSGASEYVHPGEDIAAKVSSFFAKTNHPMLTHIDLAVEGGGAVELFEMHPRKSADLYAGSQLVVFGRYRGEGELVFRLSGRVNEETRAFTYRSSFPATETRNSFVEPLWAQRRVGHLLDAIRFSGEKKELVDEIVRLSMEHGIQTPYTSFLVMEDGTRVTAARTNGQGGGAMAQAGVRAEAKKRLDDLAKLHGSPSGRWSEESAQQKRERDEHNDKAKDLGEGFEKKDGKSSVDAASYLRRLKEAQNNGERGGLAAFKRAGKNRFFEYNGMWVDERFDARHEVTTVKFGSRAYFKLIERHPELVETFKVGTTLVVVTAPGKAVAIASTSGEEDLSDSRLSALFE